MSLGIDIKVEGLVELRAKKRQMSVDLVGEPIVRAVENSLFDLEREAKSNLTGWQSHSVGGVDTNRLRGDITTSGVSLIGDTVQGATGTNVTYAPFVEFDTRPHWPPLKALEGWARRHGTTAYVVAKGISERGTKGKFYFTRAVKSAAPRIHNRFKKAIATIVSKRK